jgi:DNA-binding transcriptional LysR family regulator
MKLARSTAEGFSGNITIGFIRGYEQSLFSETLRSFHDAYPNISLKLIRDNMSALYGELMDGSCDIAFNLSPYLQTYPELSHHFLKSYQVMAILYPGHPLAGRKSVTYKDLAGEDFIIMQPQGRPNDEAEEVMICYNRGGFVPKIVAREREVQTLLLMVSAAMGIAILPEYAVRHFHNAKNLVIIPILKKNHEQEALDFEISWLPDNQNPVIEKLLKWIEIREYQE